MMRSGAAAFWVVFLAAAPICATEIAINFSGHVSQVFRSPFQANLTVSTPIVGRALYDTTSQPTHPIAGCDCMGYRQTIAGGFTAMFGTVPIRADEYVVQVKNDLVQPWGPADTLSVVVSPSFAPPLQKPLRVAGSAYPAALLQLNLDLPSSAFSNASLPGSLDPAGYTSTFNALDEAHTNGLPDVWFQVTSLSTSVVVAGDYNLDGYVDDDDYLRWRSTFASTTELEADGNRNGVVDAADYVIWRANQPTQPIAATAPEPQSLTMLAVGFVMISMLVGRRVHLLLPSRGGLS